MSPWREAAALRRTWLIGLCSVAALQLLLGLAGLAAAWAGVAWCRPTSVQDWQRTGVVLVFGYLAIQLLRGESREKRTEHLGALFLLTAVFYAHPPIEALANALPGGWGVLPRIVSSISVDSFTAALTWLFIRDFPHIIKGGRTSRLVATGIGVSSAAAVVLLAANLAIAIDPQLGLIRESCGSQLPPERGPLALFDRADRVSLYWTVVFGLVLLALPLMAWRARHARASERRRVTLLLCGLAFASTSPVLFAVLPTFSTSIEDFARSEWAGTVLIPVNLVLILSMAAITSYAVLQQHVLGVGKLLRRVIQSWLAILVVCTLVLVSVLGAAALLYEARDQSVAALSAGGRGLGILGLFGVGFVSLWQRHQGMLWLDRMFLPVLLAPRILRSVRRGRPAPRELRVLRAGVIVDTFKKQSRSTGSTEELARSLMKVIDGSIRLRSRGMLVQSTDPEHFVPVLIPGSVSRSHEGTLRPLRRSSELIELLKRRPGPLPVSRVRSIDEHRSWCEDAAAQLLVPLTDAAGAMFGILVLGSKRDDLPFSRLERDLLSRLADAVRDVFRLDAPSDIRRGLASEDRPAWECKKCGLVAEASCGCGETLRVGRRCTACSRFAEATADACECGAELQPREFYCPRCGPQVCSECGEPLGPGLYCPSCGPRVCSGPECDGELEPAYLPRVLAGKFRLERRIGQGGMGIVYSARDTTLDRDVALKTQLDAGLMDSVQLRREARAMARINLGPEVAPNLAQIYGAETWRGIPTLVIEYLAGGTLADRVADRPLGLREGLELTELMATVLERAHAAGILHGDVKPSNIGYTGFTEDDKPKLLDFGLAKIADETVESAFEGTLPYMSPTMIEGSLEHEWKDPDIDLWSLAVVAFEAVSGRNPFVRDDPLSISKAIRAGWTDEMGRILDDCPGLEGDCRDAVFRFFKRALAKDRSRRFSRATEFARVLRSALNTLPPAPADATQVGAPRATAQGVQKPRSWDSTETR